MARSGVFFSSWLVRHNPCERPLKMVNQVSWAQICVSCWASSPHNLYSSPERGPSFTSVSPTTQLWSRKKKEGCPSHADTELGCHYLGTSLSHCERDGKMGFEQMQITTLFLTTLTESSNLDSQNSDTTVKSWEKRTGEKPKCSTSLQLFLCWSLTRVRVQYTKKNMY